jgi:hypothetical protein
MSPRTVDYPTARVEVMLKDGRTLSDSTTVVRGDFAEPVPSEEVVEKFVGLASASLGAERAREVVRLVDQAETVKDVRDLTALLAPPS